MFKERFLLPVVGGGVVSICSICHVSGVYAQIFLGGNSSNGMPLSQQTLQEMQQNNSPVGSGSMQFVKIQKDVTIPPVEDVKSALKWLSGDLGNNSDARDPSRAMNRAILDFKLQQARRSGDLRLSMPDDLNNQK